MCLSNFDVVKFCPGPKYSLCRVLGFLHSHLQLIHPKRESHCFQSFLDMYIYTEMIMHLSNISSKWNPRKDQSEVHDRI